MDKKKSEVKCDNCEAKREKDCICPSPSLYGGVGSEDKRVQREIRDELGCCGGDYCTGSAAHNDRLIAFIRSHDQQLRQRIVEEIENLRREIGQEPPPLYDEKLESQKIGYNQALSDLKDLITNL